MISRRLSRRALLLGVWLAVAACSTSSGPRAGSAAGDRASAGTAQAPGWSRADLEFFLHGSMSTEVLPERVLRAFMQAYPDLYPRVDLTHFGLVSDAAFGWPLGISRRDVPHLGGLPSLGVNCAACHLGEVTPAGGGRAVRVIGMTSHFDAEAFFGAMTVATFRVAEPGGVRRFLSGYLAAGDPTAGGLGELYLAREWQRQEPALLAIVADDPTGARGLAPGALHPIDPAHLRLDRAGLEGSMDLQPLVRAILRLFHNMRAALHIPDQLPSAAPPASGPGRNDAFGLLSAVLLGTPRPYAPVKYGVVWELESRRWVHWDGNTQSPIGRNLLASLGLGAPLQGNRGLLDFAAVQRQTDLSERIRAPRYPFAVDAAASRRGAALYAGHCAACHAGAESDARLHAAAEVGTDPARAEAFTSREADGFNAFLGRLESPGYRPPTVPGLRVTGKYWAPSLAGVWARSPYLHNGSVRTMQELLTPPADRAKAFRRGSRVYDEAQLGYADDGPYVLDTRAPGNRNIGHAYGTALSAAERRDLIEYLKTL